MPIQAALHQALGVAPPLSYIRPPLRQQKQAIRQKTLAQRVFNRKLKKHCSSNWATWNLRSGRNSGLQQALLDMRDIRIGLAFLTSAGITKKKGDPYNDCVIHSKYFEGYEIVGTEANSEKQGGVAMAIHARARHWDYQAQLPLGERLPTWTQLHELLVLHWHQKDPYYWSLPSARSTRSR